MAVAENLVLKREPNIETIVLDIPSPENPTRPDSNQPPISINPDKMWGTPTIGSTRTPVVALIDFLRHGHTVAEFVEEYGVHPGDVEAVLWRIREALDDGWLAEEVK